MFDAMEMQNVWVTVFPSHGGKRPEKLTLTFYPTKNERKGTNKIITHCTIGKAMLSSSSPPLSVTRIRTIIQMATKAHTCCFHDPSSTYPNLHKRFC